MLLPVFLVLKFRYAPTGPRGSQRGTLVRAAPENAGTNCAKAVTITEQNPGTNCLEAVTVADLNPGTYCLSTEPAYGVLAAMCGTEIVSWSRDPYFSSGTEPAYGAPRCTAHVVLR